MVAVNRKKGMNHSHLKTVWCVLCLIDEFGCYIFGDFHACLISIIPESLD
jgi:hypothetical protein